MDSEDQSLAYDYDRRGAIRAEPLPPDLDASGNVVMERRRRHTRDLYGRLVRIVEQSKTPGETTWTDGATVVEYTWHAGNQLATRSADEDGDGVLETTTAYIYDSDWNLLEEIVWVDETALTTTNADLVRQYVWDPVSQNELVQSRSMVRSGGDYSTPVPVWAATDRRRDVVAMYFDLTGGFTGHARARYSPYGVPEPLLVGDLNHDGVLNDDDRAELALTRASGQTTGVVAMGEPAWNPDADFNFDGVIDEDDALALTNLVNKGGESDPGEMWDEDAADFLRGLTIGYAGMPWDELAGAWLMRNRWHDPELGRFISRDPAGYVDGMSLYAYVSGNPLKYWDPFGLILRQYSDDPGSAHYGYDYDRGEVYYSVDVYRTGWLGFGGESYHQTRTVSVPGLMLADLDGLGGLKDDAVAGNIAAKARADRGMIQQGGNALAQEGSGAIFSAGMLPAGKVVGKGGRRVAGAAADLADDVAGQAGRRADDVVDLGRGLRGQWKSVNESMSRRARAYQTQITGRTGQAFEVNGVRFDGVSGTTLLDAKDNYNFAIKDGQFRRWFGGKKDILKQADRQLRAANGLPIQWHFSQEEARDAFQRLLNREGIEGIDLIHTPCPGR